jgi:acyl phosphate:glycerol-3-phosphate acyltransferase
MMQYLFFVLLLIGSYLLGSIPTAYLLAKWAKGIDLRKYGSGNIGFTNLASSTSKWLAIPAFIFDVGKGALGVYAAGWLGLPLYMQGAVGIAAVIGHNWPVFLNFNAGRGVLTLVGAILALEPKLAVFLVLLSFLGIPFHALATTATISIFLAWVMAWFSATPVISWFFNAPLGSDKLTITIIFFCLWLVIVIRRLTVPFSAFTREISRSELMFNRFFLDRDIRSREVWLRRNSVNIVKKDGEQQSR